jgi:hypothetical protein
VRPANTARTIPAGGKTLTRITTPLIALAVALAATAASTAAFAGARSVGGKTYDACGPWNGKLRNYGDYKISNYNNLIPPNFAVPKNQKTPRSSWDFLTNGKQLGHSVKRAFVGVLDIVDEMGTSRWQVINGKWTQKNKSIKMQIDDSVQRRIFIDSFLVATAQDEFLVLNGHDLYDKQGPFRFVAGALPDNKRGTLPGGINPLSNYYVVYASDISFSVSLEPGGSIVDLTSQGTGRHGFIPLGTALTNTFSLLSELYLFGNRELVGVVDFVSVSKVELKGGVRSGGKELKVKLSGKSNYDIDTDDVVGLDFDGNFKYNGRTTSCP